MNPKLCSQLGGCMNISLNQITKSYDNTQVLNNINLSINEGEFLTLVGPSGCGKSTLLRVIAGLENASSGDVIINNQSMNKVRPNKRNLAMVFQSYALYPHLTVKENMLTPLKLKQLSFWQRQPIINRFIPGVKTKVSNMMETVNEVSKTLRLEKLLERKPGALSGGQRQRVALGRAMVRNPVAFLMDEPLSNLDAALRVHMRSELVELHKKLGSTFIYVTHDQAEALTMSNRIALMMDGDLIQVGTPEELYHNPQDKRVAEFIGSPKINTLKAKVSNGNLLVNEYRLAKGISLPEDSEIDLCVRPEDVHLTEENADLSFKIHHKEYLGSDCFLHGSIENQNQNFLVRVKPSEAALLTIDQHVNIRLQREFCFLFDDLGRRINSELSNV